MYEKCPRIDCNAEWHGLPRNWGTIRCPGSCQEGPVENVYNRNLDYRKLGEVL